MKKPSSNNKTSKTVVVSIRMTPKDKYFLELIARRDERGSTAVVIEEVLKRFIAEHEMSLRPRTSDVMEIDGKLVDIEILSDSLFDQLWAVNPGRRLIRLYKFAPSLMSQSDECIYKKIRAESVFWKDREKRKPNYDLIWEAWPLLEEYAEAAIDEPEAALNSLALKEFIEKNEANDVLDEEDRLISSTTTAKRRRPRINQSTPNE
jgi:hypothetical protein